jgi:hypothetical protein
LTAEVSFGPQSLPPVIGACIGLAMALFLALKPGEARVRLWFAVIAFLSAIWSFTVAVALGTDDPVIASWVARISYAAIALVGPCALSFSTELIHVRTRWRLPATVASLIAATICLLFPSLTPVAPRPGGGYWPLPSPTVLISGIVSALPLFYGMWLMRRAGRALPPCRRRRQLAWAWAALILGTLGGLDLNTVFTRAYPTGWAWCALASVTLFYAIAQHRLMATRTFIRQALLGTVGVAAGAIIVAFVVVVMPDAVTHGGWSLVGVTLAMFTAVRVWTSVVEPSLSYLFGWRRRPLDRRRRALPRRVAQGRVRRPPFARAARRARSLERARQPRRRRRGAQGARRAHPARSRRSRRRARAAPARRARSPRCRRARAAVARQAGASHRRHRR